MDLMTLCALLAVLLAAAPALAQTRSAAVTPRAPLACIAPHLTAAPSLSLLALPSLSASLLAPQPLSIAPPAAAALPEKVAALDAGITGIVESLSKTPNTDAASAQTAGRDIEALLTGAKSPAAAGETSAPASAEELSYAAGAAHALALRTDDLGSAKGLKSRGMNGADFLGLLEEAHASPPAAPTPKAASAASEVEASIIRVARALIAPDKPLDESIRRALAVWQVFDQEMAAAAAKGTLDAVVADARLFASQVEDSVAPPVPVTPPLAKPTPADPNGYASVSIPGSVFGWEPIETSPGHGLPPLDALIRRVLGEHNNPYSKGFEFSGAASRSEALVYLYGERHTDGGLIAANMAQIVSDMRPHGKAIILVEGYTGHSLRGYQAVEYLTARGLEAEALAATKGVHSGDIEIRGWEDSEHYDASKHPLLQNHMDLLELNRLAHGEERGWRYYRKFAQAALAALRSRRQLWQEAIVVRNGDLNQAVAQAAADAEALGATLHVIAGTDHLMQNPRLAGMPLIGRLSLRRSLLRALGGRPYWASQPPATR